MDAISPAHEGKGLVAITFVRYYNTYLNVKEKSRRLCQIVQPGSFTHMRGIVVGNSLLERSNILSLHRWSM